VPSPADLPRALLELLAVEHGTLTSHERHHVLGASYDAIAQAARRLRDEGAIDERDRLPFERRLSLLRELAQAERLRPLYERVRVARTGSEPRVVRRDLAVGQVLGDLELCRAAMRGSVGVTYDTIDFLAPIHAFADVPHPKVYGLVTARSVYARAAAVHSVDALGDDVVARSAYGPPAEPTSDVPDDVRPLRALRAFFEEGPRALAFDRRGEFVDGTIVGALGAWLAGDGTARHTLSRVRLDDEVARSVALRFFVRLAKLSVSVAVTRPERGLPRGVDEAFRWGDRLREDPSASLDGWIPRDEAFWTSFSYALVHAAFVSDLDRRRRAAEPLVRGLDELTHVPWLAHEASELRDHLHGSRAARSQFLALLGVEPPWRRTLRRVREVLHASAPSAAEVRYVWSIVLRGDAIDGITVREQRVAKGGWSRGKAIALARTIRKPIGWEVPEEDRRLFQALSLQARGSARYLARDAVFVHDALFVDALIGHPRVTRHDDATPIPVRRGTARLAITEDAEAFTLAVTPRSTGLIDRGTHFDAVVLDPRQADAARALDGSFELPLEARDELEQLVAALSPLFTVDATADLSIETLDDVRADATVRVRLHRDAGVVGFELVVSPLGPDGPALRPGEGHDTVIARGRRAKRDRRAEVLARTALFDACPTLGRRDHGACSLDTTLDLLAELRAAGAHVEWREGAPLRVEPATGTLAVRVARRDDWLEPSGGLEVDGQLVATYEALLDAVRRERRFVRLDDDRYLELTASLLRALERLEAFTDDGALHPLVALLDEPELELRGVEVERERLREAMRADVPVPRTLDAELRPYQVEGFRWMARLCRAGLGACLADDMGLGKTVQTLALLLDRARDGAALVIAPTSVLAGWRDEAARFAPALRVHVLGAGIASEDAATIVREAGPFDVVLTSYGMLPTRGELFASRAWTTAVLDEAQAIKNASTQTARAVHRLHAEARVALSGTPIENHLGELWSLFRFLVPGLLGTKRSFQGNFIKPVADVEGHAFAPGNPGRRLRERVRPFVLRREKRAVLRELPPRTELVLHVEPSDAQLAFLEALRRKDLRVLAEAKDHRFALLAALMRQRRACCAPELVSPRTHVPSAKLEAFAQLVDELRDGGHRALVFSQFVDLLGLVRRDLDARAIPYRYLDGSTSPKQREREVASFQDGEGDLFLISLKAGGTGLNLTAADYVVHLDPWWNPAAEDQASDRAHRIGQTRPVTVYRLVLQGSVEEKILAIHDQKRSLAEGLLADADDADVRVDLETLERLLRD
jgi:superfamily II DNA or RNA helicase